MSMPEPPWGAKTRRTRAARTPLSTERIVDTALELIAKEGYDAVTMRRIASALGTGPSSLYAHVASKRQLDQLLIDRIVQGVELPEPDPEHEPVVVIATASPEEAVAATLKLEL